jgi:hypothetical protein
MVAVGVGYAPQQPQQQQQPATDTAAVTSTAFANVDREIDLDLDLGDLDDDDDSDEDACDRTASAAACSRNGGARGGESGVWSTEAMVDQTLLGGRVGSGGGDCSDGSEPSSSATCFHPQPLSRGTNSHHVLDLNQPSNSTAMDRNHGNPQPSNSTEQPNLFVEGEADGVDGNGEQCAEADWTSMDRDYGNPQFKNSQRPDLHPHQQRQREQQQQQQQQPFLNPIVVLEDDSDDDHFLDAASESNHSIEFDAITPAAFGDEESVLEAPHPPLHCHGENDYNHSNDGNNHGDIGRGVGGGTGEGGKYSDFGYGRDASQNGGERSLLHPAPYGGAANATRGESSLLHPAPYGGAGTATGGERSLLHPAPYGGASAGLLTDGDVGGGQFDSDNEEFGNLNLYQHPNRRAGMGTSNASGSRFNIPRFVASAPSVGLGMVHSHTASRLALGGYSSSADNGSTFGRDTEQGEGETARSAAGRRGSTTVGGTNSKQQAGLAGIGAEGRPFSVGRQVIKPIVVVFPAAADCRGDERPVRSAEIPTFFSSAQMYGKVRPAT